VFLIGVCNKDFDAAKMCAVDVMFGSLSWDSFVGKIKNIIVRCCNV
jgi:hypothetical protein